MLLASVRDLVSPYFRGGSAGLGLQMSPQSCGSISGLNGDQGLEGTALAFPSRDGGTSAWPRGVSGHKLEPRLLRRGSFFIPGLHFFFA